MYVHPSLDQIGETADIHPNRLRRSATRGTMSAMANDDGDDAAQVNEKKAAPIGCLAMIAVPVLLVAFCSFAGGKDGGDSPEVQRYGAESACEGWVKEQLKSPSTAKFENTTSSGSGPWTVTGTVDAENSFGAMLRRQWTCTIRLDGDTFRGSTRLVE